MTKSFLVVNQSEVVSGANFSAPDATETEEGSELVQYVTEQSGVVVQSSGLHVGQICGFVSDESELRVADSVITAQRLLETAEKKALVEFAHSSVRSRSVCRKFSGRQLRVHASTFGPELAEVCETVEDASVILNDTRFDRDSMQMFQNVDNVALFIRQCQFLGVSAPSGFLIAQDAFNLKLELK